MFIAESLKIATELFPAEKWIKKSENIYVAQTRLNVNKQELEKLDKELQQAFLFEKFGHCTVLVSELGIGKHYDAICDGVKTEFKITTGNLNRVGGNFKDGLKKAENIFMWIKSNFTARQIRNSFKGKLKGNPHNIGIVFVYIEELEKMYEWSIKELSEEINLT